MRIHYRSFSSFVMNIALKNTFQNKTKNIYKNGKDIEHKSAVFFFPQVKVLKKSLQFAKNQFAGTDPLNE